MRLSETLDARNRWVLMAVTTTKTNRPTGYERTRHDTGGGRGTSFFPRACVFENILLAAREPVSSTQCEREDVRPKFWDRSGQIQAPDQYRVEQIPPDIQHFAFFYTFAAVHTRTQTSWKRLRERMYSVLRFCEIIVTFVGLEGTLVKNCVCVSASIRRQEAGWPSIGSDCRVDLSTTTTRWLCIANRVAISVTGIPDDLPVLHWVWISDIDLK